MTEEEFRLLVEDVTGTSVEQIRLEVAQRVFESGIYGNPWEHAGLFMSRMRSEYELRFVVEKTSGSFIKWRYKQES